ncbi:MAG TPA: glycosyltransferase family 4 protein [Allosphingosinicella sp.]|nr:glycosyltransferase family 4 protein [Allosphingosinicella sp.]
MIVTALDIPPDAAAPENGRRVAFIGNALPRRCGIATFTTDLQQAVAAARVSIETTIVAMNDHGEAYDYDSTVGFEIRDNVIADYLDAAQHLNEGGFDLVCLQHEFGIFGGSAGDHILALLSRLKMPVVTTFHTILSEPTPAQRKVMNQIAHLSEKVVVMAEKGWELLQSTYGIPPRKIAVIPHGVPSFDFVEPDAAKAKLGFADKSVILTFGLLAPSKGIDLIIEAMPSILRTCPDAVYVVLGATHPNLVRQEGEVYRRSLAARARQLGIEDSVVFLDRFVDQHTLLEYISMCDVYVTPYRNEAQMTSGTLAYSFGLGRAVVSTPYWHARELLADGGGVLVPFGDIQAMGREIAGLLTNGDRRLALRKRAYSSSRAMTWDQTARIYLSLFDAVRLREQLALVEPVRKRPTDRIAMPEVHIDHFLSMCDDTGLFQHAVHSIPDRAHGYCIDDNARALLLACTLDQAGAGPVPEAMTARFAAFVQHAWNSRIGRFRNFMGFDRHWLEESGSDDSHGRALWALGVCAASDSSPSRQAWAASLFAAAYPAVQDLVSPRAWAFALLGLDPYCAVHPRDVGADRLRHLLAARLVDLLTATQGRDWIWFEDVLAYDNARIPQALIVTGRSTETSRYTQAGLESLRWLVSLQTSSQGLFRPVGSDSFGNKRTAPEPYDQQPLEAAATISACLAAWAADGEAGWRVAADTAFEWFLGRNDLGVPLVDVATGSCRDGLHADRANENRGGESVVSYLLSVVALRNMAQLDDRNAAAGPKRPSRRLLALTA